MGGQEARSDSLGSLCLLLSQEVIGDPDVDVARPVMGFADGLFVLAERSPVVQKALVKVALGFLYVAQSM